MAVVLHSLIHVCIFVEILLLTSCSEFSDLELNSLYELYLESLRQMEEDDMERYVNIERTDLLRYNLNLSVFNTLESYQNGATPAKEADYPWIARVVHSRTQRYPHVSTAVCIGERIFMTAARSIHSLKVDYTSVIYKDESFPAQAFVVPSNQSKQLFDDIGLIVVEKTNFEITWTPAKLFNRKRTGDNFQWFEDLKINRNQTVYKVVGYATDKLTYRLKSATQSYQLCELPVIVDINLCSAIYSRYKTGYFVPCYHSCTLKQFESRAKQCGNYHGVEGGAVVHMKTNEVLGVATWGAISIIANNELPVGFAVPNSKNFFKDLSCAVNIRDDDALLMVPGFYQSICEMGYK